MSKRLAGRLVVLGITGSIAAYKSPEIVRALRAEGADVQALPTPAATRFVSPLTLRTRTGHAVDADLLDLLPDGRIGHIVAADAADADGRGGLALYAEDGCAVALSPHSACRYLGEPP